MELIVAGVNYRTHALAEREGFALPSEKISPFLKSLAGLDFVGGAIYLQTCHRLELYASLRKGFDPERLFYFWREFFGEAACAGKERFIWKEPSYVYRGSAAFQHLLRVASGLDSMVVGETEILGQVKEAYARSLREKTSGALLNFVFQQGLRFAKEVRTQTGISKHPVSVSTVALMLLERIFGDFESVRGLVVGAGEMGTQTASLLVERKIAKLFLMNRTLAKAENFARQWGAFLLPFGNLEAVLGDIDFLVSATTSPVPVVTLETCAAPLRERKKPLVLIDLGVPRDVEPALGDFENVYLYNVDDLKTIAEENRRLREKEAALAEEKIAAIAENFEGEWTKRSAYAMQMA